MVAALTANRLATTSAKGKAGRPAGKTSPQKENKPKKNGENTKKRQWKATALRKGWLEFRAKYLREHAGSGKTAKELNKEAGQESGT